MNAFYDAELVYMALPPDKADFSIIANTLTEDVNLTQTSGLPYSGIFSGRAGFQDWAKQMNKWFSTVDVHDRGIFLPQDPASNEIIVKSKVRFVARTTGEEWIDPLLQVVTVDLEKGQISSMKPFYWDVTALNQRIGYTPT